MPKIDASHLPDRIRQRVAELEAGQEVAARDIAAVLSEVQQQGLALAWAAQQELRKGKRPRSEAERQALGWKSLREARLEVLRAAMDEAEDNLSAAFEVLASKAEVRQAGIYMDALIRAQALGKTEQEARNFANNELTRAGLRRMDFAQKRREEVQLARQLAGINRLTRGGG